jgi:putative NIF3 family GTP cyclohydrolase 1 type 2
MNAISFSIKCIMMFIGGAGIGFETSAFKKGADVFVTGDIKHHDALDAKTNGIHNER